MERSRQRFLGRAVADGLIRDSALLLAASLIAHACNALYQVAMGRLLPADEFALLAALLSLLGLAGLPLSTLQVSISRYTRLFLNDGRKGDLQHLLRRWVLRMAAAAIVLAGAVIVGRHPLMSWMNLERSAPILLLIPLVPAILLIPLMNGMVHGMARFGWLAVAGAVGAAARLGGAVLVVAFVAPAAGWGLVGHGVGMYTLLVLLAVPIGRSLSARSASGHRLPSLRLHLGQSFLLLLSISVLMFADMVIVKHRFPEDAAVYAYASTAARMVVFLPSSVVIAMFPRVVSDTVEGRRGHEWILVKSLVLMAICLAPVVFACTLAPAAIAYALFGLEAGESLLQWLPGLTWALVPVSFLNATIRFCIAQQRFAIAAPAVVVTLLYVILAFAVFHQPGALICGLGIFSGIALFLNLLLILGRSRPESGQVVGGR